MKPQPHARSVITTANRSKRKALATRPSTPVARAATTHVVDCPFLAKGTHTGPACQQPFSTTSYNLRLSFRSPGLKACWWGRIDGLDCSFNRRFLRCVKSVESGGRIGSRSLEQTFVVIPLEAISLVDSIHTSLFFVLSFCPFHIERHNGCSFTHTLIALIFHHRRPANLRVAHKTNPLLCIGLPAQYHALVDIE